MAKHQNSAAAKSEKGIAYTTVYGNFINNCSDLHFKLARPAFDGADLHFIGANRQ